MKEGKASSEDCSNIRRTVGEYPGRTDLEEGPPTSLKFTSHWRGWAGGGACWGPGLQNCEGPYFNAEKSCMWTVIWLAMRKVLELGEVKPPPLGVFLCA